MILTGLLKLSFENIYNHKFRVLCSVHCCIELGVERREEWKREELSITHSSIWILDLIAILQAYYTQL